MKVKVLKEKKCKHCKEKFKPIRPLQYVCGIKCATAYAEALQEKKEKKEWSKKKKEGLEKLKTLSDFKKDLELEINAIVRLIDKGHECISSNKRKYVVNAGHFYSVGSYPSLRYNLLNIFNQSVHDNWYRGGNEMAYEERLKEVFGMEVFEEISGLTAKYPELHLTIPEIKKVLPEVRRIKRELLMITEDEEKPFSTSDRIRIRKELNKRIGIYK